LGAWVRDALGDAGVKAGVSVVPGVHTLRLELSGDGVQVSMARKQDRLVTTVNEQSNCTHLPQVSDYLMMREELGIVGRDPAFERVLASAVGLAGSSSEGQ